jgi:hypothetical protein
LDLIALQPNVAPQVIVQLVRVATSAIGPVAEEAGK